MPGTIFLHQLHAFSLVSASAAPGLNLVWFGRVVPNFSLTDVVRKLIYQRFCEEVKTGGVNLCQPHVCLTIFIFFLVLRLNARNSNVRFNKLAEQNFIIITEEDLST